MIFHIELYETHLEFSIFSCLYKGSDGGFRRFCVFFDVSVVYNDKFLIIEFFDKFFETLNVFVVCMHGTCFAAHAAVFFI